jgi:vacuolar protein-sorting-associated protein 4
MSLYQVEPSKLKAPDITTEDFFQAIARIKPSVSKADLERQIEFTNNFGQDG